MSAMQVHRSHPWHGSYGERPFTIEPASTTALEMFRTVTGESRFVVDASPSCPMELKPHERIVPSESSASEW